MEFSPEPLQVFDQSEGRTRLLKRSITPISFTTVRDAYPRGSDRGQGLPATRPSGAPFGHHVGIDHGASIW
jgi:hypothetical protein